MGKKYYVPYIIYVVCMSIMPLTAIVALISSVMQSLPEAFLEAAFWICVAGIALTFLSAIPVIVMSVISVFKGLYNPVKITMITKLVLIPVYIGNFMFYALLTAGFLNPFLMLAIPILWFLGICGTYMMMIVSGLPLLAYVLHRIIKRNYPFNFKNVAAVVFQFVFCLDVAGAIMLYTSFKDQE